MMKPVAALLTLLIGCQSGVPGRGPGEFVMCDERPETGLTLGIDFETGGAHAADELGEVRDCSLSTRCMSFPLYFSVPPRLPNGPGDRVSWAGRGVNFSIRPSHSPGAWVIEATAEAQVIAGRRFPPQTWIMQYGEADGLRSVRPASESQGWVRCRGHLRFDDLASVTQR